MKKILALLLTLCCIMGLAACSKNTDNLPTLSSITEMEEAAVNELLKGYYRDQLIEVWGEPTSSNDNEDIWVIDDITLTVNTNNNGEVVICGLSKSNDEMNAITFPDELPELTISYGEEEITVWVGGHSWVYEDENGEMNTITADSNHPLHCMETMSFIPI